MMKTILISLLLLLSVNCAMCQLWHIPSWYQDYLFDYFDEPGQIKPVGLPILWDSKISGKYLSYKLKYENKIGLVRTLSLIGMTRDTSFVSLLKNYLNTP